MKKNKKIKLELDKEIISSLSDDLMNNLIGGKWENTGVSVCESCETDICVKTLACQSMLCPQLDKDMSEFEIHEKAPWDLPTCEDNLCNVDVINIKM